MQKYIGTRDFLPRDWDIMQYVFGKWRSVSKQFGFEEYDAPIIENVKLFTDKSGEEIKRQLFWFKDKGDRELCLRAEITPQLARYIVNYGKALKKPLKWFSIPRLFRYERPQKGRFREFFQYNADIIGESSVLATVEIINLTVSLLKGFGLKSRDVVIKINSRKIIDALANRLGVYDRSAFYLLLDKRYKLDEKRFNKQLKSIVKEYKLIKELFSLKSKSLIVRLNKLGFDVTRIKKIFELVDNKFIEFDLSIIRGLAYYTDVVFEAFDKKLEFRAILGGGEYDNLVRDFGGPNTPAVGLGIGDAVLLEVLKKKKLLPTYEKDCVFIATIGNVFKEAIKLRNSLIEKGYSVDLNLSDKGLGKQLNYASSKGISKVYILGEKEIAEGKVIVKNLITHKEKTVRI